MNTGNNKVITYDYVTPKNSSTSSQNECNNVSCDYVTNKIMSSSAPNKDNKISYDSVANKNTNESSKTGEKAASYEYVTEKNTSTSLPPGGNEMHYDYVINENINTSLPAENYNVSYEYVSIKNTSSSLQTEDEKLNYDYVISNSSIKNSSLPTEIYQLDETDIYLTNSSHKYEPLKTKSNASNESDKNNLYESIGMPGGDYCATDNSIDKSLMKKFAGNSVLSDDGTNVVSEELNKQLRIGTIDKKTNCLHATEYDEYDRYAV